MKLISWNVNGLRACLKKGFMDFFKVMDADIFCLQETKMQQGQAELDLVGYDEYWNSAVKKAIPARRSSPKVKQTRLRWTWHKQSMEWKGACSLLNMTAFIL